MNHRTQKLNEWYHPKSNKAKNNLIQSFQNIISQLNSQLLIMDHPENMSGLIKKYLKKDTYSLSDLTYFDSDVNDIVRSMIAFNSSSEDEIDNKLEKGFYNIDQSYQIKNNKNIFFCETLDQDILYNDFSDKYGIPFPDLDFCSEKIDIKKPSRFVIAYSINNIACAHWITICLDVSFNESENKFNVTLEAYDPLYNITDKDRKNIKEIFDLLSNRFKTWVTNNFHQHHGAEYNFIYKTITMKNQMQNDVISCGAIAVENIVALLSGDKPLDVAYPPGAFDIKKKHRDAIERRINDLTEVMMQYNFSSINENQYDHNQPEIGFDYSIAYMIDNQGFKYPVNKQGEVVFFDVNDNAIPFYDQNNIQYYYDEYKNTFIYDINNDTRSYFYWNNDGSKVFYNYAKYNQLSSETIENNNQNEKLEYRYVSYQNRFSYPVNEYGQVIYYDRNGTQLPFYDHNNMPYYFDENKNTYIYDQNNRTKIYFTWDDNGNKILQNQNININNNYQYQNYATFFKRNDAQLKLEHYLLQASRGENTNILGLIVCIQDGADPNTMINNLSPLIYATQLNRKDVIDYFLKNGANPFLQNASGKNAYSFAQTDDMINLLNSNKFIQYNKRNI